MKSVAFLRSEPANMDDGGSARINRATPPNPPAEARPHYLGPATVTRAGQLEVEVRLRTGAVVVAQPALAFTYEPVDGDLVLVIGDLEGHYVIGVLQGSGRSRIELPGDVDVRAVGGVLRLSGDKGVEIAGPDVTVQAGALRTIADTIMEACGSLRQRVSDLFSVHAGQRHSIVDGTSYEQSKSAAIVTEEKVTINGKQIYLG